ncbi:MAG: hypothetical protein LBK70_00365 [Clostridiales bacterium]|jgi:hypothetical protein|nr:hypothetical protein [Clostridiales bacterium]
MAQAQIRYGQIVNVLYGHGFKGGKLYSYNDPTDTRRTGQNIVVDVTKGGKTYNTLATIQSTHASHTVGAEGTKDYLKGLGVKMKTLKGGLSQTELPGYYRGWKADAKAQADLLAEQRMLPGMMVRAWDSETGQSQNYKTEALKSIEKQIASLRYSGVKFKNQADWNEQQKARYNRFA